MGRRTLSGHKLVFTKYREKEEFLSPADLNGINLADDFEAWARIKQGEIVEVTKQSFLRIDNVCRYSDSIVLVDTMAGRAGEPGEIVDIESSEVKLRYGETDVPAAPARALLFCPQRGQAALWFSEYSSRSSGAYMLLRFFHKEWKAFEKGSTMNKSRLIASEIALHDGIVNDVEVRITKRDDDRAQGNEDIVGTITHKFKPTKKRKLSGRIIDKFRKTLRKLTN